MLYLEQRYDLKISNNINRKDLTNVIKNIKIIKIYNNNLTLFLLIIRFIINISTKNIFFTNEFQTCEITLKIKGIGLNKIFDSDFFNYYNNSRPNHIYINGNTQNEVKYIYDLTKSDNLIRLVWNNKIKTCYKMFYECDKIYDFNFSEFDTSEVTDMYGMFYGCVSLISLNLSNFITSNVNKMWNMFFGCSSLISLNLSNFITSQVYDMEYMFNDCKKLEYINLKNFDEIKLLNSTAYYGNMFDNVPDNVVVCINENKIKNKILPQIKNKACYAIDCSENWKIKQKKLCGDNFQNYIQDLINVEINKTQNREDEIN